MAVDRRDSEEHDIQLPDVERPGGGFEPRDVNAWAIGKFGIGLVLLCLFAIAVLFGLFHYFQGVFGGPVSPEELATDARRLPPLPRLQETPILDLQQMRAAEDKILDGYGWIDQEKGIVRIPIRNAMDLLAARGLPSQPLAPPPSAAAVPTESGLGPIMTQPGGPLAPELYGKGQQPSPTAQ